MSVSEQTQRTASVSGFRGGLVATTETSSVGGSTASTSDEDESAARAASPAGSDTRPEPEAEEAAPVSDREGKPTTPKGPAADNQPAAGLQPGMCDAYFAAVSVRPAAAFALDEEAVPAVPELAAALAALAVVMGGYPTGSARERETRCRLPR